MAQLSDCHERFLRVGAQQLESGEAVRLPLEVLPAKDVLTALVIWVVGVVIIAGLRDGPSPQRPDDLPAPARAFLTTTSGRSSVSHSFSSATSVVFGTSRISCSCSPRSACLLAGGLSAGHGTGTVPSRSLSQSVQLHDVGVFRTRSTSAGSSTRMPGWCLRPRGVFAFAAGFKVFQRLKPMFFRSLI